MFDITDIILAALALVSVIISTVVVPYVKSKTSAQQQAEINSWVKIAVSAAEQIYVGSGRGAEKKQYVLDWLHQRNITVDETKLDAMIESAVYALKTSGLVALEVTNGYHHRKGRLPRRCRHRPEGRFL